MRNEITLSDIQIENTFHSIGFCLAIEDVVFTRDSIDNFKSARTAFWSERGRISPTKLTSDGQQCLIIKNAQTVKGQTRRDVYVIDFGTVRATASF